MSRPKRGRGQGSERPSWIAGGKDGVHTGGEDADDFVCAHCGLAVAATSPGTSQRNHCPHCLWSLHVDIRPGDRAALCRAPMEPIALWVSEGGELRLLHRCTGCGVIKPNRIAGDDSEAVIDALVDRLVRARSGNTP
jgi:hypothetical protein